MKDREQTRARTTRFKIGDEELETVKEFKYLGRITSDDDDDLPAVREKKRKTRWARVSRVSTREGATAKMMGKFYLAVVQSVYCTEPKRGFFQEDGRNARRSTSMRETNDEAVHTQTQRMKENGLHHRSPPHWRGRLTLMTDMKKNGRPLSLRFAETRAIYRKCRRSHLWRAMSTSLSVQLPA
jgi:hypothetical protein